MPPPHTGAIASALHLFDDDRCGIDRCAVVTLAKNLRGQCGSDIGAALAAPTMPERVRRWSVILAGLADVRGVDPVDAWRLFTEHPCLLVEKLEPFCAALGAVREANRWRTLAEIYQAWYQLAAIDRAVAGVTEHEAAQGVGPLSRTRWLLLAAPYRPGFPAGMGTSTAIGDPGMDEHFVSAARSARDQWLTVLAEIDDYPGLAAALPDVEAEIGALTAIRIERTGRRRTSPDRAHTAITQHAVTRLLLPRFAWTATLRAVRHSGARPWGHLIATGTLALAAVVCFVLAAGTSWHDGYTAAAALAALGYAGIAAATLHRRALGWLWLLRQPASAAVGLLALAAMPANWWWQDKPTGGAALQGPLLQAAAALAAVGAGYLAVEVTNHSVRGGRVAWRSVAVALSGVLHAFRVSLIGMRWIVPAFAAAPENDPVRLSCWWSAGGCGPHAIAPWLVVLAATAWSFVAGVFLQILWDDQPITAPLTHVTWRHGR